MHCGKVSKGQWRFSRGLILKLGKGTYPLRNEQGKCVVSGFSSRAPWRAKKLVLWETTALVMLEIGYVGEILKCV